MVEVAARAGWPACGIWFDPASWDDSTTREVGRRLDDCGIVGLDLEPVIPAPDHDDHGERIIEVAARLGIRHVLFTSRLPDIAATRDRFAALVAVAAEHHVTLMCEFLPIFPLRDLTLAVDVVEEHPPATAGILVDNLHLSRSGGDPDDLDESTIARLHYLQIADAPAASPVDMAGLLDEAINGRLVPGEGSLPIERLLRAVPEVPLSFEVRSRSLREGFVDDVERAASLLDRVRGLAES